jgi:hypothetical protein
MSADEEFWEVHRRMEEIFMTDESNEPNWEFAKFFEDMRKSASIKVGAVMFGEAQGIYYDTLKQHMTDEEAYNMLAHTTESLIRGISGAAGPVLQAFLSASTLMEYLGVRPQPQSDKEVPGGG